VPVIFEIVSIDRFLQFSDCSDVMHIFIRHAGSTHIGYKAMQNTMQKTQKKIITIMVIIKCKSKPELNTRTFMKHTQ